MEHISTLNKQAENAKAAGYILGQASIGQRNSALSAIADALGTNETAILRANATDIEKAKVKGIAVAMLDRLKLDSARIKQIASAVRDIVLLPDVLGEGESWERPNGLTIARKRVPLGLVGMIYEARPNVTVDATVLCLKTGNSVFLRGGAEAFNTNMKLVQIMKDALEKAGLPKDAIQIVEDTSRETATAMMKLQTLDVLIPRGSGALIKAVRENATVPIIETGTGNCHTYIDEFADLKMALEILINAKCSRPSVCNACETLLVHKKISDKFLKTAIKELKKRGVDVRYPATEEDLAAEFNDLILAVKVVDSVDDAISHINKYNTKHSDCIVTGNLENAQKFQKSVDAACVYVNASTRFSDGYEFGFGAEIGISTQKLHARGPMGLKELTTIKYVIMGNGQTR